LAQWSDYFGYGFTTLIEIYSICTLTQMTFIFNFSSVPTGWPAIGVKCSLTENISKFSFICWKCLNFGLTQVFNNLQNENRQISYFI